MKAILPYILLFVGSLLMVSVVMGGVYWLRPDLLGLSPARPPASADLTSTTSTTVRARPAALPMYGPTLAELRGKDQLNLTRDTVATLRDSLQTLQRLLAAEKARYDSLRSAQGAPVALVDSSSGSRGRDGKERKAMARMLESMAADNVVKLLHGMSDEEVKDLLMSLKTKQAAKILAALDPDRAAKLIR